MKRCQFCDEEIRDNAIKCKHCGEMLKRGVRSLVRSAIFLVVSLGYAASTWMGDHAGHNHTGWNLLDPEHMISLAAVLLSAYWTCQNTVALRRGP